ncbi:unnamed protein product [Closterium sp. Yama58-4]|nr:unnamed protein product [Closterium sp. Yama58-4]
MCVLYHHLQMTDCCSRWRCLVAGTLQQHLVAAAIPGCLQLPLTPWSSTWRHAAVAPCNCWQTGGCTSCSSTTSWYTCSNDCPLIAAAGALDFTS